MTGPGDDVDRHVQAGDRRVDDGAAGMDRRRTAHWSSAAKKRVGRVAAVSPSLFGLDAPENAYALSGRLADAGRNGHRPLEHAPSS